MIFRVITRLVARYQHWHSIGTSVLDKLLSPIAYFTLLVSTNAAATSVGVSKPGYFTTSQAKPSQARNPFFVEQAMPSRVIPSRLGDP